MIGTVGVWHAEYKLGTERRCPFHFSVKDESAVPGCKLHPLSVFASLDRQADSIPIELFGFPTRLAFSAAQALPSSD